MSITVTLKKRLSQSSPLSTSDLDSNWSAIEAAFAQAGSGTGTVTSVGLSAPAIFVVSGSPVTGAGSLSLSLASQSANLIDRKSTRLNSSHIPLSRMPSSA